MLVRRVNWIPVAKEMVKALTRIKTITGLLIKIIQARFQINPNYLTRKLRIQTTTKNPCNFHYRGL